ncbi:MAG: hypothetical protein IJN17_07950 [Clostridia bacterium]|nr:hypothetical protein [Clostridia bacterium]
MKAVKTVFLTFIIISFLAIEAHAFDPQKIENEVDISPIIEAVPDAEREYIPNGENALDIAYKTDTGFIISLGLKILKKTLPKTAKTLCTLLCFIVSVSLINSGKNSISSPFFANALTYATLTASVVFTYGILMSLWETLEIYMTSINTVINAMLPSMALIYTMGGNATAAVVSTSGITFIISILNVIFQHGMLPLIKICYGLSIAEAVGAINGIREITKTVKNIYTFVLSTSMTLLSIFLLFKTNIAASADGAAARTIKFAGSFIPIIGSAIGESIRTVMSGVELIKNSVGFVGIIILIVITLPTLLHILTTKICIDISSGIASVLECEKESALLKELSSILGFSLAITVCVAILLLFEMTVFISISPVLGGN